VSLVRLIIRQAFRYVAGLVLLFLSLAVVLSLWQVAEGLRHDHGALFLAAGFAGGLAVFGFVVCPVSPYVLGHELTHWLTAKLFLRRTRDLRIGRNRGSVAVERPNVWIILTPYFVPFYSILWLGIYGIYRFVTRAGAATHARIDAAFMVGLGITYAFHVALTLRALRREQADFERHGRLLSLTLVLFLNLLVVFTATAVGSGQPVAAASLLRDQVTELCTRAWDLTRVCDRIATGPR
jgi:hypothetical protein